MRLYLKLCGTFGALVIGPLALLATLPYGMYCGLRQAWNDEYIDSLIKEM